MTFCNYINVPLWPKKKILPAVLKKNFLHMVKLSPDGDADKGLVLLLRRRV